MIFNNVITSTGKVDRLLRFIQESNFYFAFGKSTIWSSEWGATVTDNHPPAPALNSQVIPEVFIYKKAFKVLPAVPSGCGVIPFQNCSEVTVNGKKWTTIDLETNPVELFNILVPRHVYLSVVLDPNEIVEPSFRTIGLYKGLTLQPAANPEQLAFRPYDVKDPGILYWASYHSPIAKQDNKVTEFEILISL